jgi:hypothetical protein
MKLKNYLKTTFILAFILIFNSCNIGNDKRLIYYHEALNYITDSTLYSHFPDEDSIRKHSVNIPCVGGNGLEIVIY